MLRIGYWAFQLASEVEDGIKLDDGKSYNLQPEDDGEVCYYFLNYDDSFTAGINYGTHNVKSATIHYVSGKYIYSSCGWAGYMEKGEATSYGVDRIKL